MDARTTFILPKPNAIDPADLRNTTISLALARLFYRISSQRIDSIVEFSKEQRTFRTGINVCGDITIFLDSIIRSRYELSKSKLIAMLDTAKAYLSVKHSSMIGCSRADRRRPLSLALLLE